MKVGVLQTEIDTFHPDKNFSLAFELILDAISRGCKLILLPELWFSSFNYTRLNEDCSSTKKIIARIVKTCTEYQVFIAGTYVTKKNSCFHNSLIVSSPFKTSSKIYNKMHLIPELDEGRYFSPGTNKVIVKIEGLSFGSAICFDLRFPSLFSYYRSRGVNSMLLPAQWPLKRIEHWLILTKARAIENQFYMIAANGVGRSGGILLGGNSLIVDPWGNVLAQGSTDKIDILTATVDGSIVDLVRSAFPIDQKSN